MTTAAAAVIYVSVQVALVAIAAETARSKQ